MNPRKIIYVTGTRADYGLMCEVLQRLNVAEDIMLSLCVTGMHLSPLYGHTIKEIEAAKLIICGIIPINLDINTQAGMAESIGHEIIGMTELFARENPDLIMVLGDRGEMLAAAIAAVHLNIPVVHFHGGERSGTVDEMVRHAISKLSHYHFVATESSKLRLIKMGEAEHTVIVVGAPGLEEICRYTPCGRGEFNDKHGLNQTKKNILFIYHPVVQEFNTIKEQFEIVLKAALATGAQVICLEPNSDAGGHLIRDVLQRYKNTGELKIIKHLLRKEYIDCLANSDVMLGNSSSGIIEAASLNLPVINVGSRQNLRECSDNIIHVDNSFAAVTNALNNALNQEKINYINVYGDGKTSEKCYELLRTITLEPQILNKCNAY